MRIYIVVASINELRNLVAIQNDKHECKVIVVDEGDELLREKNKSLLRNLNVDFYGPRERFDWFKKIASDASEVYASVIPEKCHAETSFGFLVALEEDADIIIEIDDDIIFPKEEPLIESHIVNLYSTDGLTVSSKGKWYNTIENLKLNLNSHIFPRGHPYDLATRSHDYKFIREPSECVLNMGVWSGHPDLDALTILYNSGLDGRCHIKSINYKEEKVIVDKGNYFAICSMNTSFRRKIIPAFYQLYMKYNDIDRFDDIWSGIFIKKIADHLGDKVCLGRPIVYHDKRPRNIWNDLRAELEGMIINEYLWRITDSIELNGKDYYEAYSELIDGLALSLDKLPYNIHRDFMTLELKKMRLWLRVIDSI
jgi:hypothetical protein